MRTGFVFLILLTCQAAERKITHAATTSHMNSHLKIMHVLQLRKLIYTVRQRTASIMTSAYVWLKRLKFPHAAQTANAKTQDAALLQKDSKIMKYNLQIIKTPYIQGVFIICNTFDFSLAVSDSISSAANIADTRAMPLIPLPAISLMLSAVIPPIAATGILTAPHI